MITLVVLVMSDVQHAHLLMPAIRAKELWFKISRQLDIVIVPIKENGNPFSHRNNFINLLNFNHFFF